MVRNVVACAFVLLFLNLSGCLFEPPLSGVIPFPLLGDRFAYRTQDGKLESSVLVSDDPLSQRLSLDEAFFVVRHVSTGDASTDSIDAFVSVSANRVLLLTDHCPFVFSGSCTQRYIGLGISAEGQPWGAGSSMFQGQTLRKGLEFSLLHPLADGVVDVHYRVEQARRVGEAVEFVVRGEANVPSAPGFFQGMWRLSTASPYALEYEAEFDSAYNESVGGRHLVRYVLEAFERGQGSSPVAQPTESWVRPRQTNPVEPLDDHLPPGTEVPLGWNGYSFGAAWNYLLANVAEIREASQRNDFHLRFMQVPTTASRIQAGFTMEDVQSTFDYVVDQKSNRWSVTWRCRYLDATNTLLDCKFQDPKKEDYSTSPLPATRPISHYTSFREAWALANETLPESASGFSITTMSNNVENPAYRQEYYRYRFHFPLYDDDGKPVNLVGYTIVDGATGNPWSTFLEREG